MRIELVGGLGIGKSTLCKALEKVGFNCIYENLKTNPFLDDCFVKPQDFRFPSQMWFVLSKFHEIKKFEKPGRMNVLDQSALNVMAYTRMLFKDEDPAAMEIINQCFGYMEKQTGKPNLLINLQCSPQEQMRRIRGRNRAHEKTVTLDYIIQLQAEVNILLDEARGNGYSVMDIDTEAVYLPDNMQYAERLAENLTEVLDMNISKFLAPANENSDLRDKPDIVKYVEAMNLT